MEGMMKLRFAMKKGMLFFLILLLPLSVLGHGNILYDISLDFDPEMKAKVTEAAQSYLGIDEQPSAFDFDKELIVVHFDRQLDYTVTVNPIDYSVFGARDDSLYSDGEVQFDEEQRKEIAQRIFDQIPEEYKAELKYAGEKKQYSGSFIHTWYRYADDIYVAGDHLEVEINGATGEVIGWRLSLFFDPKHTLVTTPAITHGVAQKIAELGFNAEPEDYNPVLVIYRARPVWITKVIKIYPQFIAVDALNGELIFSGGLRDKMPEGYDYGRGVEVVENDFIKEIYGGGK